MAPLAGRYELLALAGRGGMGEVWNARLNLPGEIEKLVAVKRMHARLTDDPELRQMFIEEARIAAQIDHPNVVPVFDVVVEEQQVFVVMERVEGITLHELARIAARGGERLPLPIVLRMLSDACAGLHALHEHHDLDDRALEIVHGDVSPDNLLVATSGATRLIDFGVARSRPYSHRPGSSRISGKPRFMAPEQARGEALDRRADVWAIGTVLYRLVTGRFPYPGRDEVDFLCMLIDGRAVDPVPSHVPAPVARVLQRALSVDRDDRHATCAELARDLDRAANALGGRVSVEAVADCLMVHAAETLAYRRAALRGAASRRRATSPSSAAFGDECPPTEPPTLIDLAC